MLSKRDIMTLSSLAMLQAIKYGNGKRAAARVICTSIDTLNKYIENLEHRTGVKLLDINGKSTSLTTPGEYIVNIANQIERYLFEAYNIKQFYQNSEYDKYSSQIKKFSTKMDQCTKKLDFENAMKYRNKIRELEKIQLELMSENLSKKMM